MFADKSNYCIIGSPYIKPEITVAVLTFNHEKYLKQSLDSILCQEIDVTYNIVVADDFSTDSTRQILLGYQQKYPNIFKLLFQNKNCGVYRNGFDLFSNVDGKYVAILEGDDYWTSKDKLNCQLNYMMNNPEAVACFHNVDVVDENGVFKKTVYSNDRSLQIRLKDLIKGDYMKTCSLFYKNCEKMADEICEAGIELQDTSIGLWLLSKGKFAGFLNISMAAYRIHSTGVWSPLNAEKKMIVAINMYHTYYNWSLLQYYKGMVKNEALRLIKSLLFFSIKKFRVPLAIECLKLYKKFK